ncbi:hypothetical protein LCM23_14575 [Cytobacillus kochii]|uniref:hypothetical protein n=1 Tax=Cytobacillus kochii TaxID=859143 RepID=UPI001CD78B77|nr:hypothetical protein [Cytobacillus kochii]MCA1027323.1 hypothetical protein [Cytobacillus kochii]
MTKKFKASMLKDEVDQYSQTLQFPVKYNEEEYIVKLYPFFSPVKISELVNDLAVFFKGLNEEGHSIDNSEEVGIVNCFILKHFSDMQFYNGRKAKNRFKKLYDEFKYVINSEVCQILIKSFPVESMEKVYEKIAEVIETGKKFERDKANIINTIKELPLENEFLKEKALNEIK